MEDLTVQVENASRDLDGKTQCRARALMCAQRCVAVCMLLVNAVFVWDNVTLFFERPLALSHAMIHGSLAQWMVMVLSSVMLMWPMYLTSWSLTQVNWSEWRCRTRCCGQSPCERLQRVYRFAIRGTTAETFGYFTAFMCRLGPTIAVHYLRQIDAYGSAFEDVMSSLDLLVFVAENRAFPVALVLSLAIAAVLWACSGMDERERCRSCCCQRKPFAQMVWRERKRMERNLQRDRDGRMDYGDTPSEHRTTRDDSLL
jgi:hypothetical protein